MKLDLSNTEAIIFDFGGVIYDIDYHRTEDAFYNLGISKDDTFYSQQNQIEIFDQLETGKISPKEFRDELRNYSFLGLSDEEIDAAWNSLLIGLPEERLTLLERLTGEKDLYLLSNTNEIHCKAFTSQINGQFGEGKFLQVFRKYYYSHEVGMRKPQAEIFKLVLHENSLDASKTLFIDDSKQHIDAANQLGIKTHWLKEGTMLDLF